MATSSELIAVFLKYGINSGLILNEVVPHVIDLKIAIKTNDLQAVEAIAKTGYFRKNRCEYAMLESAAHRGYLAIVECILQHIPKPENVSDAIDWQLKIITLQHNLSTISNINPRKREMLEKVIECLLEYEKRTFEEVMYL